MKKYGPTLKTKVYIGGSLAAEDVTVSLPEISFKKATVQALGDYDIVTPLTDAIEATVHHIGHDKGFARALGLKPTKFEFRWIENELKNTGEQRKFACKAFLTGTSSGVPGGDLTPGEIFDGSIPIAVSRFQKFVDGKEVVLIDKLKGVCKLNGTDYARELNTLI